MRTPAPSLLLHGAPQVLSTVVFVALASEVLRLTYSAELAAPLITRLLAGALVLFGSGALLVMEADAVQQLPRTEAPAERAIILSTWRRRPPAAAAGQGRRRSSAPHACALPLPAHSATSALLAESWASSVATAYQLERLDRQKLFLGGGAASGYEGGAGGVRFWNVLKARTAAPARRFYRMTAA